MKKIRPKEIFSSHDETISLADFSGLRHFFIYFSFSLLIKCLYSPSSLLIFNLSSFLPLSSSLLSSLVSSRLVSSLLFSSLLFSSRLFFSFLFSCHVFSLFFLLLSSVLLLCCCCIVVVVVECGCGCVWVWHAEPPACRSQHASSKRIARLNFREYSRLLQPEQLLFVDWSLFVDGVHPL